MSVWSYICHHSPYFADLVRQADMVHVFQSPMFGGTCFVPFYTAKIFTKPLDPARAREKVEQSYTSLCLQSGARDLEKVPMRRGVLDVTCLEVVRSQVLQNGVVYIVRERLE